ncbi:MAG TPA: hypothetical protein VGY66_25810 [Gemmataceae bacterium]|jgi:hypothetical protein|nr:hypothetical protein [Gemmataceae bacterium]
MRYPKLSRPFLIIMGIFAVGLSGCGRHRPIAQSPAQQAAVAALAEKKQAESLGNAGDAEEEAVFANDRGEKFLAEDLPPARTLPGLNTEKHSPRVTFPVPSTLATLQKSIPPAHAEIPPPNKITPTTKKPAGSLPEGLPLAFYRAEPVVPERRDLPAGERVRVSSSRLDGPLPLPPLATPYQEPLPTDDATAEYSLAAALAAPAPRRTSPAPFLRLTVPDPFENRPAARLRGEWAETPVPVTSAPRPPQP